MKKYRVPEDCPPAFKRKYAGRILKHDPNETHHEWVFTNADLVPTAGEHVFLNTMLWAGKLEEVKEDKWLFELIDNPEAAIYCKQPETDKTITSRKKAAAMIDDLLNASPERQALAEFWLKDRELPEEGEMFYSVYRDMGAEGFTISTARWIGSRINIATFMAYGTTDKAEAERMAECLNKIYGGGVFT